MKNTFVLVFRGTKVAEFTSVYDVQHVVLTFSSPQSDYPKMALRYKTLAVAQSEGKVYPVLNRWASQSFIVEVKPGTTEVTDLHVPTYSLTSKAVI